MSPLLDPDQDDFAEDVEGASYRLRVQEEARRRLKAEAASKAFHGFEGLTLDGRLALERERPVPIVDGLIYDGHKAFITSGFKVGKTTLSGNLVRSMVDNEPFLGRFDTHLENNVGVLDYELTEDDCDDMYARFGIRKTHRVFVESLRGKGFSLANDFHVEGLVKFLNRMDIEFLVVDPFGRAMAGFGSENENDDVRRFLMRLDEVMAETDVRGMLIPVHTGRMQHAIGEERARGATVIDDDADVRIVYTKQGPQRFFRADGRRGVNVEEFAVSFDPSTGLLAATEQTRADFRRTDGAATKAHVMAQYIWNAEPDVVLTQKELFDAVGGLGGGGGRTKGQAALEHAETMGWVAVGRGQGPKGSHLIRRGAVDPSDPLRINEIGE
jgi:hypothetical protein